MQEKSLKNKVRMSYAVSTVSIAMVLFLLGSVGYMILGLIGATDRMRESVEVNVMLRDGLGEEQKNALRDSLAALSGVREVVYVSKEQAAREFIDASGDDFSAFIDFNPLPDSYTVRMSVDGSVASLEAAATAWDNVREVVYQRAVVEKIGTNITKFQLVLLIFGGVLLVISVILLNNTLRMSVYAKRHIISTMKLVGARRSFIMQPFVRSSILQGIYAALIAAALFLLLVAALNEELPEITSVAGWTTRIVIAQFALGIAISLIFTTLAVRKFTRMHTNAINLF